MCPSFEFAGKVAAVSALGQGVLFEPVRLFIVALPDPEQVC